MNLVANAIEFSPAGADVTVRVAAAEGAAVFGVVDRGPGISAEALPHVFDRYWQAEGRGPGAVGLGLSIAQGAGHRARRPRLGRERARPRQLLLLLVAAGMRPARTSAPPTRRALAARLRAAAPARHGRVRQLRAVVLDHLDPDRRGDALRLRPPLRRAVRDDGRLAARHGHDAAGRREPGRARLGVPDRGRALPLVVDPRRARLGLLHRVAQHDRAVRDHRRRSTTASPSSSRRCSASRRPRRTCSPIYAAVLVSHARRSTTSACASWPS